MESNKRHPDELIKSYTQRVTKANEKSWPGPDNNNKQRTAKCMEYFLRGTMPPALKQKAHHLLTETPTTLQHLKDHVATKDLSCFVSSELMGTTSSNFDNKKRNRRVKESNHRNCQSHERSQNKRYLQQ